MNPLSAIDGTNSKLDEAIDRACLEFETAWSSGRRPDVAEYLRSFSGEALRQSLPELLSVEWEQLRRTGVDPVLETYVERFADFTHEIRSAWEVDAKRAAAIRFANEPRGGRYRILKSHARGGLGQVYVAHDDELGREVALKEIQPCQADGEATRERFLREARITGKLEHPGIVPVYGMGQNSDGTPFYAMRFVQGESLREAIERFHARFRGSSKASSHSVCEQPVAAKSTHRSVEHDTPTSEPGHQDAGEVHVVPAPAERINRVVFRSVEFQQLLNRLIYVCHVIEFAHERGVVHRDLKPGNIMLGKHGETLVVDWGLAKETGFAMGAEAESCSLQSSSEVTSGSTVLGTPAYMSPEQAAGQPNEIGPASDIYSLGATLFHLLTGKSPMQDHSLESVLERVRTGGLARPQAVLPEVPPALDAICAKAMSVRSADRYPLASALAGDLERWLADEPIAVYAEPIRVRAGRWSHRHATLVTTGVAATLLVTIGLATIIALMAFKNRQLARARTNSEKRLTQVAKGAGLLAGIFKELDPFAAEKEDRPLQAILGEKMLKAAKELEGDAVGDPLLVDELQHTLGSSLIGLGHYTEAIAILTKSRQTCQRILGEDHPDTLSAVHSLAVAYQFSGDVSTAIRMLEMCHTKRRTILGENHSQTLSSLRRLGGAYQASGDFRKAIPILEMCLAKQRTLLGEDDPETLALLTDLASVYLDSGDVRRPIPLFELCLTKRRMILGENHPMTIGSMADLANAYSDASDFAQAIPLLEVCLDRKRSKLGQDHPRTLHSMHSLAVVYRKNGELGKALPMIEQCLKHSRMNLTPDHPDIIIRIGTLANVYFSLGQVSKALPLFEESLAKMISKKGEDHPDTLRQMQNLAAAHQMSGDSTKALPLLERCLMLSKTTLGEDHPATIETQNGLAAVYQSTGDLAKAIPLFEHCLARLRAIRDGDHVETLVTLNNLATAYLAANEGTKALPLFEQCLTLAQAKLGADHPESLGFLNNLAACHERLQDFDQAISLYQRCLDGRRAKLGHDHPETINSLHNLAETYINIGDKAKALPLKEEGLKLTSQKFGPDHPETLLALWDLAWNYQLSGQSEMAVPPFEQLLERRRSLLGEKHADTQTAKQHLSEAFCGLKEFSKAETLLRDCWERRKKAIPDDWRTFNTQSWLGTVLTGQKRFEEAEPLLIQGYEGLVARQQKIPAGQQHRLNEAIQHLVELYTDWGMPEEAATWKARLARHEESNTELKR